ncbi:MAG: Hpt domain-containing protein, partial [Pseudomonadota bacterium]
MGEIRDALARSKAALFDALAQDADSQSTLLKHAKTYLHQAHGALQIVDVDGVAIITETIEDLFDRLEGGKLALTEANAHVIERAYQAVIEYLEELLTGALPQPVRLFPYYRALLEIRGADRIHPADLFFPNLAIRPQLPQNASASAASTWFENADYASLRLRFEKALLLFLKNVDPKAEREITKAMLGVIAEVERRQFNSQAHAFWWVMHSFAEEVSLGNVAIELYAKQLFGRINMQIRRLVEGSPSIAERLLRDALFFIARAENPSIRAQQVRAVYQLNGVVPQDYEKRRYGQIDVAALAVAKERLAQAKNIWSRIAGGDANLGAAFEQEMRAVTDASTKLNAPALPKLMGEINGIARHALTATAGNPLGLELATSLLFVENSLEHINRLPEDFAQRADAVGARLLSIVAGESQLESVQWMDDLSRQAQQRQTVLALATEMKASLRQVEKTLDEYFVDPSKHIALSQIDPVLHQIEGALAILDLDDAMRAIQHTQAEVKRFAASGGGEKDIDAERKALQAVAQNIGALGFFVEMLPQNVEAAKNRFSFDDEQGTFRANLIEKNLPSQVALDVPVPAYQSTSSLSAPLAFESEGAAKKPIGSEGLPTVEDELAIRQQQSVELAASLVAEPNNAILHEQLKESLEQVRFDAALLDDTVATDQAQAAIDLLQQPDFSESVEALSSVYAPVITPVVAEQIAVPAAPVSDDAIDAELLEIFMLEAEEVLAYVKQTIPESRGNSHSQEHLTTLRRSFHTLKGSGRMVGLTVFAEAAAAIEQVMNLWLSEARAGSADLYALLDKSYEVLNAWVEELNAQNGQSSRSATALVNAAERLKNGESFVYLDAPVEATLPVAEPEPEVFATTQEIDVFASEAAQPSPLPLLQAEEVTLSDAQLDVFKGGAEPLLPELDFSDAVPLSIAALDVSEPMPVAVDNAEVADQHAPEIAVDDSIKRIGQLELSVPLYNIYIAETDQIVRLLSHDFAEWRHELHRPVTTQAVHAAHSLGGSSATVGFNTLQEVAHSLEMVLQSLARKPVTLIPEEFDVLEHCVDRLRQMLQTFALGEMSPRQPDLLDLLTQLMDGVTERALNKSSVESFVSPIAPEDRVRHEAAADHVVDISDL